MIVKHDIPAIVKTNDIEKYTYNYPRDVGATFDLYGGCKKKRKSSNLKKCTPKIYNFVYNCFCCSVLTHSFKN